MLRMTIALGSDIRLMGFDPSLKHLACLATMKSCDTTKLSVDDNIYMIVFRCVHEINCGIKVCKKQAF